MHNIHIVDDSMACVFVRFFSVYTCTQRSPEKATTSKVWGHSSSSKLVLESIEIESLFATNPVSLEGLARWVCSPGHNGMKFVVKKHSLWTTRCWKPHDPMVISFESIPACDGQMDGRMDTPPIAKSRSSTLSAIKTDNVNKEKHQHTNSGVWRVLSVNLTFNDGTLKSLEYAAVNFWT